MQRPSVYDRMLKMEPVSSILRFKRTDNYRRCYDKASVDVCAGLCLALRHAPQLQLETDTG